MRWPPAPARWRSTPSGPRATATPAGLPRSSCAVEGSRHRAGRPDRLRLDWPRSHAAARRRRVDPARRDPGPALPGRAGAAADPALRHRARRPAAGLSRASAWPRWWRRCSASPGQGALGGRLVDPAAAGAVAALRRTRRRGARRAARRPRRRARRGGQGRLGARGVRRDRRGSPGRRPRRPMAAHLRAAPGTRTTRAGRRTRPVGDPRPARRASATSHRAGCCPTQRSSPPPWPCPPTPAR